jgi:hypothetical protein
VRYQGAYADRVVPQRPGMRRARDQLAGAIEAARDFATRQDLETWPAWFERALAGSDEILYHADMVPSAYQAEARRLAAMAVQAWVFGGMGS